MGKIAKLARKKIIVSLRFSILAIFVMLFSIAVVGIIVINYQSSSKAMLYTANKLMHEVSASLHREFSSEIERAARDGALSAELIEHGLLDVSKISEMVNYTYDLAYQFNIVQSAFWGDKKGTYVKTEYEPNDSLTTDIVNRNVTPPNRMLLYRDKAGTIIKRVNSRDLSFDPRKRIWYQAAAEAKKPIWTDIYIYEPSHYLGITMATPVYYVNGDLRGVFAIDIRLDWLSWYVGQHNISPNGFTFIVTTNGKLIAFPNFEALQKPVLHDNKSLLVDIHSLSPAWLGKSFDLYRKSKKDEFSFSYLGQTYLAVYKLIPTFAMHGWLIAVVVPKDDFIGDLKKSSALDVFLGILILLMGIAFVSALVTYIVKPMKKVVKQMDKLKNFDLSPQRIVDSRIEEVKSLSESVQAVRAGLKSFRKYVPASLVRKLIKAGEDARIGGTKKTLTVFFSDIENFTSLSEKMDPNLLMEHICEYFDELSKIIVKTKGTIDKYIGDSLMVFWGAPLPVWHPWTQAAEAALSCKHRIDILNKEWKKRGKPVLSTRIGLHIGEAIVGNVGSSKRLNYTALGDVINVTKRLEAVNKLYGTRILVSHALFQYLEKDFIFRKIDCVALKGKVSSMNIYELLAKKKEDLGFDIETYNVIFEKAFQMYQDGHWEAAIHLFFQCIDIYPVDTVAAVFIKRCQFFKTNPPAEWSGVWRMVE